MHRSYTRNSTKETMNVTAHYNEKGQMLDPNTNEPIEGAKVIGHPTGLEWNGFRDFGQKSGMTQKEMNDIQNNGSMLQWESKESNAEHKFEEKDPNATALNTANYCYLGNTKFQETTYINPPAAEGESWTLTTKNVQTGIESQIGTFNPDLGEVTPGSKAAIGGIVQSNNTNTTEGVNTMNENDLSDFGTIDNPDKISDEDISEGTADESYDDDYDDDYE